MTRYNPGLHVKDHLSISIRQRGFTLIEVMMSVILIAIGTALAIPSYRDMVEKRQLTNATEQITSFVNATQGISSRTNQIVTISYSRVDDDDWCVGAVIGETACDCTETNSAASDFCAIDADRYVLDNSHTGNLKLMHDVSGDGDYAFDPIRGIFVDMDDAMELELRSPSGAFRLNVQVNSVGQVTVCSDDSNHSVPGYAVCPVAEEPSS